MFFFLKKRWYKLQRKILSRFPCNGYTWSMTCGRKRRLPSTGPWDTQSCRRPCISAGYPKMPWHPDEIQGATHLQTSWTTATGRLQRPRPSWMYQLQLQQKWSWRGRKMNDCEGESRKEKKKRWNGKGRLMVWLRFRRRSVGWICWREEERVSKKLITFQTFWLGHGTSTLLWLAASIPSWTCPHFDS